MDSSSKNQATNNNEFFNQQNNQATPFRANEQQNEISLNEEHQNHITNAWIELFLIGKLPNRRAYHVSFFWQNNFYIHGGQDLKEGNYGDLERANLHFLNPTSDQNQMMKDQDEIDDVKWSSVQTIGNGPKKLSHHSGVLQNNKNVFIIYGGITDVDSVDLIYVLDLSIMKWDCISSNQQKEKNGKPLPGPRDDFLFTIPTTNEDQSIFQPMYLFGGFKNGIKMNDLYKLETKDGKTFIWEQIEIASQRPDPRSGFHGSCFIKDQQISLLVFGGNNVGNDKLNDLWLFKEGKGWELIKAVNQEEAPFERSGHQTAIYKNRYFFVFGGMQEVTNELNDLYVYDLQTNKWHQIENDNKNASNSGSPRHRLMHQTESFKKGTFSLNINQSNKFQQRLGTIRNNQQDQNSSYNAAMRQKSSNKKERGKSLANKSLNQSLAKKTPKRKNSLKKKFDGGSSHGKGQLNNTHHEHNAPGVELLTPTSISMKNAFIIKNADQSFDHYFHQMKKRKGYASPTKIPAGNMTMQNFQSSIEKLDFGKVKFYEDKQPPGRDGHSSFLYSKYWIIFGGDRHHMPFNDTYVLDLDKCLESIQDQ